MAKKTSKSGGAAKVADLTKLNWYCLQKAMYEAWGMYDKPDTKEQGRTRIKAVYAEYARRGVSQVVRPEPAQ